MSIAYVIPPRSFSWDISSKSRPGALDEYRDSFEGLYEVADVDPGPSGTFFNRTLMTLFAGGVIGHGRSTTQTLRRAPSKVGRSGYDSVSLILVNSPMAGRAGDRNVACAPGSILLLDLSRPSESRWHGLDLVNLVVPRDALSPRLATADIHGLSLAPQRPAGRLIASHLRTLAQSAPGLSEAEGQAAIAAALLITESAMGGTPSLSRDQAAALHRTVRESACRFLDSHLLDPGLTADRIARACAVSRATLYRAFEGQGGLIRHIQRRRLDLARATLARRVRGRTSVADIAHAHGFASPTHFSRAFRDRFGLSPSEVEPLDDDSRPAASSVIRHRAVIDWLKGI